MKTSRKALLPSAIAAVLASPFVMLSGMNPAHAQTIIDGGATETVIGDGSGTQPSPWNPGTDILVGNAGVGVLNISGGGIVVNNFIGTIGNLAGSSGTVNVNGAGSAWTNANALAVGGSGTGVLHIENGGSVSSVIGAIGDDTFSSGAVTVDGAGSHWTNTDSLTVGNGGAGTLEVSNGGAVSSAFAYIGLGSSSTSAATIDGAGSTWTNSDDLYVGVFGTGALAVENGGSVSAGTIFLGGALSGGTGGDGTLNISDGGAVSSTLGSIGFGADSNGAATIDGAGSTWTNTGDFYVGFGGNATLNITNGGAASTGSAAIGGAIGSIGTANINGAGSNWTSSGQLYVGFNGTGTLNILNGGSVSDFLGMLGSAGGSSGSVIVSGAGSVWTHADDLIVGNSGAGTLILADGGRVVVGGDLLVGISGGQGTVNIGAVSGATPTAPGVLDAASVALDPTGSLVFNHTGAGYVFAPEILGNGVVRQLFGTTILTGGSGTFTGPTRVESGELRVNGSLAGSVVTVTGGVLGGTGTVGGLAVQADGTVAPGNSIGILNVAGDVVFNPGSIYAAEVDATAGQFDQIIATGAATLTGANLVVTPTGTFTPGSRYALITAGSVSGSFGSVTGLGGAPISAFVTPFASYDATHAYLEVDVTRAFADAAETHNQTAAAAGAQSLAVGNPLYLAVAMSADDEAAREAFDLLSGEIHASTQTMLIEDGRFARETALERAHSADGRNVWGRVYGSWADDRGNEEEAQIKRDIAGVFVGVDGEFNHWRVGVMAGYGQTDLKMDARSSSGKSDAYHLGVYGGTHFGAVGVRLGASYVRHDVSTNRAVEFDGYTDRLSAEYKANTTQVFGEAGYDFKVSEHTTVAPFVNLALVNHKMDSFVEHGSEAALSGEGGSTRTTFATVGLSAATKLDLGGVAATAKGVVGWHYAFGDVEMVFTHALAGGSVFTVHGVPVTENSMLVEAGLEFEMGKESALGISYNGLFGGDYADNGVMLDVNLKF